MIDITYTSIETITAFHITSGDYLFTLDELQNATLSQSQEKTDITGKQGRKLSSLKKNKAVTVSGANGMVSGGLMEVQTGNTFSLNQSTTVLWTDYLVANSDAATTHYKAVGTVGNEIDSVYLKNADGTLGTKLEQAATVAAGKFTYTPDTKALAFSTGEVPDGTDLVVYYKRRIRGDVLTNMSDTYSGRCALYLDAFGEDKCSNLYRVQFYIPKADFSGDFSLEIGENQTVHNFEAESLAGACGLGVSPGALWTYTVFGANTEDVA